MKNKTKKPRTAIINPNEYADSLISFSEFVEEGIAKVIIDGHEKYHTILRISGIDIFGCSPSDKEIIFNSFALSTSLLKFPHKYIFTSSNPVLSTQKEFIEYKLSKNKHPFQKQLLKRELQGLKNIECNHKDKVAYLNVFCEPSELQTLKHNIRNYINSMDSVSIYVCNNNEYTQIMRNLLNFDTSTIPYQVAELNEAILPDKIQFSNNYYIVNDKYVTCLKISDYPSFIDDLLFADLFNTNDMLVSIDVNISNSDVISHIKKSLSEINSRGSIPQNVADRIDDITNLDDLTNLYQNLSRGNEKLLTTTVRYYLSAPSFEKLNSNAENLKTKLENLGISVIVETNNMIEEFKCLSSSADTMQQAIPLHDTYKRQFPFYYQSLIDEQSYFLGQTATGGVALFNNFYKNSRIGRDSYDTLVFGSKGAGKSALLKSMLQSNLIVGHKAMVIDVENEYRAMSDVLGGRVIDMTKNSIINVLHLHLTIDVKAESDDTSISKDVLATNYASELSRISTFFHQYYPTLSDVQNAVLLDTLDMLYKKHHIDSTTDITKLKATDFPTLLDYYELLMSIVNVSRDTDTIDSLAGIVKPLSSGAYASLFNGHSSIDISDNNFIVFNVKNISEMEERVYNAQLFNILTLMWSEVARNYSYNANIKNSWDRRYIMCLIDEAHRFINTKNMQVTEFIEKLVRRARKYFAGLWFATQNITDFVPSLANENSDKIRTIFSLCQYKIIMKQDYECVSVLEEIFPQFTHSELMSVPTFSAGTMLMSVSTGRQKITATKYISPSDFMYMGTQLDILDGIKAIYSQYYGDMSPEDVAHRLSIKENREYFLQVFVDEVYDYFRYERNCSKAFEKLIIIGVKQLIEELRKVVTDNA